MDGIQQAKLYEKEKQYEKAAKAYLALRKSPQDDWMLVKAGEMYYRAGDLNNAKKAYDKVKGCGNYILYDELLNFYLLIKDYKSASKAFIYCCPDATQSKRIAFADRLFKCGAYNEAEKWYLTGIENVATERNPYLSKTGGDCSELGYFNRGNIRKGDERFEREDYAGAYIFYNRVAKNSQYAKTKAAECCFLCKEFEKAKKHYRELVQDTDNAYYMFMIGECYNNEEIDTNTMENAVYWYEYALEKGCKLVYYHLGLCYQFGHGTEKNIEKAKNMYEEGAKYKVDGANCLCKLGNLHYINNDFEKATSYYRQAAEKGNARALTNIAIGYFNKEITCFSNSEIRCFLAKAAALGNRRALGFINDILKGKEILSLNTFI